MSKKISGITKKIDSLGRIVLQSELCKTLGISIHNCLETFTEGDAIIFALDKSGGIFCGDKERLVFLY